MIVKKIDVPNMTDALRCFDYPSFVAVITSDSVYSQLCMTSDEAVEFVEHDGLSKKVCVKLFDVFTLDGVLIQREHSIDYKTLIYCSRENRLTV